VHNLFPRITPVALRAARSAGAAVVVTLHNYRLMCLPATLLRGGSVCEDCIGHMPWRGVVHRCYRDSTLGSAALALSLSLHGRMRAFDEVTRFLAVSDFVRRKHIEAGIPPDRIVVKANFTWPVEGRRDAGEYFLFLGRLSPEKGVDTLLRAWRLGGLSEPLLVVGDGPEEAALRRAAPSAVRFAGQVASREVPGILARARALVAPSRWYEAAPRSIIEAYAAGVPVLASDFGALSDLVTAGVSGLLVAPEDAGGWVEAVRQLADDERSERLGVGARRRWSEHFSPEQGLLGLEDAYREAMAAR
jgi:glycosyltransferase involved in cell wall biosynthesis